MDITDCWEFLYHVIIRYHQYKHISIQYYSDSNCFCFFLFFFTSVYTPMKNLPLLDPDGGDDTLHNHQQNMFYLSVTISSHATGLSSVTSTRDISQTASSYLCSRYNILTGI